MREMHNTIVSMSEGSSDNVQNKMEKLATRIEADYKRAEDWSAQKRELSMKLWRKVRSWANDSCTTIIKEFCVMWAKLVHSSWLVWLARCPKPP